MPASQYSTWGLPPLALLAAGHRCGPALSEVRADAGLYNALVADAESIREELARISQSRAFSRSTRLLEFLKFTVNETLAGRQSALKEYSVGVEVYGRGPDFDPKADSIVRTEAARLRAKLDDYYSAEGKCSRTIIRYPKGGYAPIFEPGNSAPAPANPLTLAVLPFVETGGIAENEYFADGLTDELIAALAAIDNLRVIARTSVFEFKGRASDVREIGRRLGADALVEGTIRTFGTRVRITAQLVDVATGSYRWSQTYEREWRDIFGIQAEITRAVASSLARKLRLEPAELLSQRDSEAHRLYLRGRYSFHKWTVDDVNQSLSWFRKALARDPNYVSAWSGIGDSHCILAYWGVDAQANIRSACEALTRALQLDSHHAEAESVYAGYLASFEWQWNESERRFRSLIERGHTPSYFMFAMLCLTPQSRLREASEWMKRALEIDPLFPGGHVHLGRILYLSGQYEEAVAQLENTLELNPDFREAHWQLALVHQAIGNYEQAMASFGRAMSEDADSPGAWGSIGNCYAVQGKIEEARRYQRLLEQHLGRGESAAAMALLRVGLGEFPQALDCLEECYSHRSPVLLRLKTDPRFSPLRNQERFRAILAKVGLAS